MKLDITLDPWQKKFLETKGDKILCTGRQVGKSLICAIDAGEYAIKHPKEVILIIAPTERQAYALFDKVLNYLSISYKTYLKKGKDRPTKSKITLTNGTVLWCLPTGISGIGIRFLTVHRLYEDEASRIPEEVQTAVTPMLLTTGGDTILLSTPFGTENYFYDVLANKDEVFDSFTRFTTDSETVIKERKICETWTEKQRDKALQYLKEEKARMTELQYAQEYMGKPLFNLRQVFPDKLIKECMVLERRGRILPNRKYYLGVDVAGMGADESTFEIIDGTNKSALEQVENQITKKTRITETTEHIIGLNRQYNFKKEYIDSGGLGIGVCDQLRLDNDNKRKVIEINNASRVYARDSDGKEKMKKLLKEELYNNLLRLMERGEIKLLKDPEIYQSLKSVQFEIINDQARYFGNYTHIAEGLIRAAWCAKDKGLNIFIRTF